MAVREHMKPASAARGPIVGFALIWSALTLIVGAIAFVALYAGTGLIASASNSGSGQPLSAAPALVSLNATQAVTEVPTLGAVASNTPLSAPKNAVQSPAKAGANVAAAALQITATPGVAVTAAPVVTTVPVTSAPTATIPAIKDTAFDLGIQVQDNNDPKVYDLWMQMVAPQLKLNWFKDQVRWSDLEKTKGTIDFSQLDITLAAAAKYNLKVMLSIVTTPNWARERGADLSKGGPPGDPQDYVNFVTAIVSRYPGKIHAIEVWNEENLDREWASVNGLNPNQYVTLLSDTYKAVKAIDPNIIIASGALSPVSVSNPPAFYDDFVYMDLLIKAGMLNYVDCVGAHHNGINLPPTVEYQDAPKDPKALRSQFRGPYDNPHHEWSFKSTLEGYHARIAAAGSSVKLCVTEFGWPSMQGIPVKGGTAQAPPPRGFEFAADNTLADQADYTKAAIDEMMAWGWVRLAFVWNLNYAPQIGWDPTNDNVPYSILGPGYNQRPVWLVIDNYDFRDKVRTASP